MWNLISKGVFLLQLTRMCRSLGCKNLFITEILKVSASIWFHASIDILYYLHVNIFTYIWASSTVAVMAEVTNWHWWLNFWCNIANTKPDETGSHSYIERTAMSSRHNTQGLMLVYYNQLKYGAGARYSITQPTSATPYNQPLKAISMHLGLANLSQKNNKQKKVF